MDSKEVEAKNAAENFINSLSAEEFANLKRELLDKLAATAKQEGNKLAALQARKQSIDAEISELWEKEKGLTDYKEKSPIFSRRQVLNEEVRYLALEIMNQQNVAECLLNGGDFVSFTDKKGVQHERLPYYSPINTDIIGFDEKSILIEPRPPYVPLINEETFKRRGFVFDAIRVGRDEYLFATTGYSEKEEPNGSWMLPSEKKEQPDVFKLIVVTLDQLVLINQYYYTKAKAIAQQKAEERTLRAEQSYDRIPEERRIKHFGQVNFYRSLPAAVKKKIAQPEWEALPLSEKEALYKPHKHYGPERLVSKLEENSMWVSYHKMYERFIDPSATQPKQGYANHKVFLYWEAFRDMMKWKIKDLKIQREALSEMRLIALETSFGDSNTSTALLDDYGILIKRQNGNAINPAETDQIKNSWELILATFGNLKLLAATDALKISHTGKKLVFASKAAGMYLPTKRTIAVSDKFGSEQFSQIFAHEAGHYIDHKMGERAGKRYITDDYEGLAGKIAFAFRSGMNTKSDSDYTNATKECFARALEQYFAIKNYGVDAQLINYNKKEKGLMKYILEEDYVSLTVFNDTLKSMIDQFLLENKDFFGAQVKIPEINKTSETEVKMETAEETITARFELPVPTNLQELEAGVDHILTQGGSRKMGSLWVIDYLEEHAVIGKEFMKIHELKSRANLESYLAKRQTKVRKPHNEQRKKESEEAEKGVKEMETEMHVTNILNQAFEQSAEMDKAIEELEAGSIEILENKYENGEDVYGANITYKDQHVYVPFGNFNKEEIQEKANRVLAELKDGIYKSGMNFEEMTGPKNLRAFERNRENIIYPDIKSCLLADGDIENDFIIEGSKIINTEGGASTTWEVIGFRANGVELKHIAYSVLTDNKGNQFLTFEDLKHSFNQNYVTISGLNPDDTQALNLCIKAIKKCMNQIDQVEYHKFVTEKLDQNHYGQMPPVIAEELAKYWGMRKMAWHKKEISLTKDELDELQQLQINIHKYFPQFDHYLTSQPINAKYKAGDELFYNNPTKDSDKNGHKVRIIRLQADGYVIEDLETNINWMHVPEDHLSLTDGFSDYEEVQEHSATEEIEEQIALLKETLPLLKGKTKKEVKENIDLLIESLELLKAA